MKKKVSPAGRMPKGDPRKVPKRKSIQSVEFGIRLLEALVQAPASLALREVADASEMSRSQTHRYLLSYVNTGLVRQDPSTSRYELGPVALRIGLAALRRCDPIAIASEEILGLTEEVGFGGLVLVWGDHGATIVRQIQGRRRVVTSLQVGSTVSALNSSAGRVFLVYMQRAYAVQVAREEWKQSASDEPNGWKTALAKIEHEVRTTGLATATGTTLPGLTAASAPVLDSQGQIAAVLTLVAQTADQLLDNREALAALAAAGRRASSRLGYQPDADLEAR